MHVQVALLRRQLDKNAIDQAVADTAGGKRLLGADQMTMFVSPRDLKRLEAYARNMVDNHMVRDLIPTIANMYFFGQSWSLINGERHLLAGD